MTRIFWKKEKKQELAEVSFAILADPSFTQSSIEAVRQAMMQVIAPDQHRTLTTMSEVGWIIQKWADLKLASRVAQVEPQPAIKVQVHPEERIEKPALVLADVPFADLWAEMGRRLGAVMDPAMIRAQVRAETNATIDRRMPGIVPADPHEAAPKPEPVHRRPKIAILGLTNGQTELMRRTYKGAIDLHFYEGSEGRRFLRSISSSMDLCIKSQWCKGHLGSTKDFENFQATNGGLDTIRGLINRTFNVAPVVQRQT